jgi:hypothetical protein
LGDGRELTAGTRPLDTFVEDSPDQVNRRTAVIVVLFMTRLQTPGSHKCPERTRLDRASLSLAIAGRSTC